MWNKVCNLAISISKDLQPDPLNEKKAEKTKAKEIKKKKKKKTEREKASQTSRFHNSVQFGAIRRLGCILVGGALIVSS